MLTGQLDDVDQCFRIRAQGGIIKFLFGAV